MFRNLVDCLGLRAQSLGIYFGVQGNHNPGITGSDNLCRIITGLGGPISERRLWGLECRLCAGIGVKGFGFQFTVWLGFALGSTPNPRPLNFLSGSTVGIGSLQPKS